MLKHFFPKFLNFSEENENVFFHKYRFFSPKNRYATSTIFFVLIALVHFSPPNNHKTPSHIKENKAPTKRSKAYLYYTSRSKKVSFVLLSECY